MYISLHAEYGSTISQEVDPCSAVDPIALSGRHVVRETAARHFFCKGLFELYLVDDRFSEPVGIFSATVSHMERSFPKWKWLFEPEPMRNIAGQISLDIETRNLIRI